MIDPPVIYEAENPGPEDPASLGYAAAGPALISLQRYVVSSGLKRGMIDPYHLYKIDPIPLNPLFQHAIIPAPRCNYYQRSQSAD
jgi:hypothetical protein